MAKEYRFQFIAVCVAVHLLVLYELGHFRLFLSIELIYLTSCLGFRLADNCLVNQKRQHGAYLMLDGSLACVHFGHEQGYYIVYCRQEGRFVNIRKVTYHKEHIHNTTIELLLFRVCNVFECLTCIGNGTLTKMLHGPLEHGTKEAVERDKLPNFHISGFLSYGEGDVDERTFISLHLLIDIVHVDKRVEHLHDELELIGHKRIASNEIFLACICFVLTGQYELGIEFRLVLVEHIAKRNLDITFLFKNTLLGDILRRCALQRCTHLETSKNLANLVFWIAGIATHIAYHLFQGLLRRTSYPAARLTNFIETLHQRLKLKQKVTVLANELAHLIDEEQDAEVTIMLILYKLLHFCSKCFYRNIHFVVENTGTYDIRRKCWVNFFGHLQGKVKATSSKARDIALPIIALALHILLELLELTVVVKSFLKILSQGKVERVVAALCIKLVPENGCERCCLISIHVMHVTNVEHHHLDISL